MNQEPDEASGSGHPRGCGSRVSPRSIPRKLYKYRPFDVFCLRILTDAEASYSDPRCFNDPLDCDPTIEIDIGREAIERLCYPFLRKRMSKGDAEREIINYRYLASEDGDYRTNHDAENYLKRMLGHRIKRELDQELGTKGVFSLSEHWDSALMWSHYANYHRGICIEFDTAELLHPNLKPVNYRAPRSIRASDLLAWKQQNSAEAAQRILDTYFYAKAAPWRYEREWRDLGDTNGPAASV
jgi:hypothetical protein